jgi:hypothetical protein
MDDGLANVALLHSWIRRSLSHDVRSESFFYFFAFLMVKEALKTASLKSSQLPLHFLFQQHNLSIA